MTIEFLSMRAKLFGFRLTVLPKARFALIREGIIGGGYQGKIVNCLAYLDGWEAHQKQRL